MSTVQAHPGQQQDRRVRHRAGEAAAVMAFSAATSTAIALLLLVLASLTSRG